MSYVADKEYPINGNRSKAIRLGLEPGLYEFICDYAEFVGMSRSSAVRRLTILGARCEADHGNARMPGSFEAISATAVQRSVNEALSHYVKNDTWLKDEVQLPPDEPKVSANSITDVLLQNGAGTQEFCMKLARELLDNYDIREK